MALPIGNVARMDIASVLSRLDEYCHRTGLSRSTVALRATGNARLIERMERKASEVARDVKRLESFMASNPVAPFDERLCEADGALPASVTANDERQTFQDLQERSGSEGG